jgi:hypothetical protein
MSTYMVYLPEWQVVFTSDELEVMGQRECGGHFEQKYAGRVREEDWRICGKGNMRPQRQVLQLRLPNLKGEFTDQPEAESLRAGLGELAVLVPRGGVEERELLSYGRRRLPRQ